MNVLLVLAYMFGFGAPAPAGGQAETPAIPVGVYQQLTPQEAKKRLDADPTIKLVDVRTAEEYRGAHIPNSMLIPLADLERLAPQMLPNKADTIFVHCQSGRRSREAAMKLLAMGYTNVYDIGGIKSWPYETVKG